MDQETAKLMVGIVNLLDSIPEYKALSEQEKKKLSIVWTDFITRKLTKPTPDWNDVVMGISIALPDNMAKVFFKSLEKLNQANES